MSNTRFTKGEWKIDDKSWIVVDGIRSICNFPAGAQVGEHDEFNAHLIAAAPEMYDLLSTIENDNEQVPEWLWNKIQETLAKARGEQ